MFIKKLIIERGSGEIIRDILFHKGLNIIVDEIKSEDRKESGNNIGKTTLLKLIDYCLGSSGKNIYEEDEFKGKISNAIYPIKDFLIENRVIITLILVNDLITDSNKIVIRRNFLSSKEKIYTLEYKKNIYTLDKDLFLINEEDEDNLNGKLSLNSLIFDNTTKKPSFRQLISRNIRYEKTRLTNVVKVLHPATSYIEYEPLYLFWFGISTELSEKKKSLYEKIEIERKFIEKLEYSEANIKQKLNINSEEIREKEILRDNLNVNKRYSRDLYILNEVKRKIGILSSKITALNMRKNLILESRDELKKSITNIDKDIIEQIYYEAKLYIPNLQRSFEDTLLFHNKMINNKIDFITKELPELEKDIEGMALRLKVELALEEKLTEILKKSNTVDELLKIMDSLKELYKQDGTLNEQLKNWEKSNQILKELNIELSNVNKIISYGYMENIEKNITDFNSVFSEMSNKLYNEKFILTFERYNKKNKEIYSIDISPYEKKPYGSGRKITQIAAFDLSYIVFADSRNIKCLHFLLQDEIEKVHDNQINTLIDILDSVNCQYIIPVLADKLPENIDVEKYKILSLSEDDKLFRFLLR